jgi:hypothetical protein
MGNEIGVTNEKEIQINYGDFYIAKNETRNTWYARHWDEELYQDDIIIDISSLKEEPIELFDGFILDINEFKEIERIVTNII